MRALAWMLLGCATAAGADSGTLTPRDKQAPDAAVLSLDEMRVEIVIDNGDAHVSIVEIFANHTGAIEEGAYRFAIPGGGTVSDFAVWDGAVRIPAVILERKRAEQVYDQARLQAVDPGLLEAGEREAKDPRATSLFTAKIVPIPAYGTKRLEIEYHQRIAVSQFKQYFALSLKPDGGQQQSVRSFSLHFVLRSAHAVASFTAPSTRFPLSLATGDGHTVEGTMHGENLALDEDFVASWLVAEADKLAVITYRDPHTRLPGAGESGPRAAAVAEPGFFEAQMLLGDPQSMVSGQPGGKGPGGTSTPGGSPAPVGSLVPGGSLVPVATPAPVATRTVLLLFDTSLSMQWEKLERSYAALEATLRTLKSGDRFNVLLFNQSVRGFRPQPVTATAETVRQAQDFVRSSNLRGGTDLPKALSAAMAQSTEANTSIALFTDGGSDRGETVDGGRIAAGYTALWERCSHPPQTDVFAVGDDANLPLLRKLARHGGFLEAVLSTEPIEFHLQSWVAKLTRSPVAGVALTASPGAATSLIYAMDDAVYPGSVAEWVGQYQPSQKPLTLTVHATREGVPLSATAETVLPVSDLTHAQLPRIWAQARVDALLAQIDRGGETEAAIEEIIRLSRRYKFVTPYTSFLAVPRSLLRPRVIRPGDPVLRVRTDAGITSVIAIFPFGLTKGLRHLASEDLRAPGDEANRQWETRFLAPPEMKDGVYSVRLILRDTRGNTYREAKTFVIASTPPVIKLQLPRSSAHRGGTVEIRAAASSTTRTLTAHMDGIAPATLRWNAGEQASTGTMAIPGDFPIGRYTLTVTAEDIAHNLGSQEVRIDVVP